MDYLNYYPLKNISTKFFGADNLRDPRIANLLIKDPDRLSHFKNYKHSINYTFNSKGFRDFEWPNDLSNVVWCLGDSFTLGVGIPQKHTWPYILQQKSGRRCLNLGIHGASNDLLRMMAEQIYKNHDPKNLVIMWSFFHRRHGEGWNLSHYFDHDTIEDDFKNFESCLSVVNSFDCNVVNLLIPNQKFIDLPNLYTCECLDYGRDGIHFDFLTAKLFVSHVLKNIV